MKVEAGLSSRAATEDVRGPEHPSSLLSSYHAGLQDLTPLLTKQWALGKVTLSVYTVNWGYGVFQCHWKDSVRHLSDNAYCITKYSVKPQTTDPTGNPGQAWSRGFRVGVRFWLRWYLPGLCPLRCSF